MKINPEDRHTMPKKDPKKKGFVPTKKRSSADDDDSIDSKGNIRGLIDYGSESEDSYIPSGRKLRSSKNPTVKTDTITLISKLKKEKQMLLQKLKEIDEDEKLEQLERDYEERKKAGKKIVKESEDEDEDEDEDDEYDDDEEYDEDEEMEVEEESKEKDKKPSSFMFSFGGYEEEKNVPRRHNMKKETSDVQQFVKLITTPSDEDTIDGQIDQFKARPVEKKTKLLTVLESRNKAP